MKHLYPLLLLTLHSFHTSAQPEYALPDSLARATSKSGFSKPDELSKALCKNLKTDTEKARAIFTWVALNTRYDFKSMDRESPGRGTPAEIKAYRERLVQRCYRLGKGICMDYARLYQHMAEAVGVECAFIPGHSKGSVNGGWAGHAWNAVKINGAWRLLDVTWAAGYGDAAEHFTPEFRPGYFFSEPRLFALSHFPDEEKWQLLETPISKMAFKNQSNVSIGDVDGIQDFEPFAESLSADSDGKATLRLKIRKPPATFKLQMNGREIPHERKDKDGWVTLRFVPGNGRNLEVFSVSATKKGYSGVLIGVFKVK